MRSFIRTRAAMFGSKYDSPSGSSGNTPTASSASAPAPIVAPTAASPSLCVATAKALSGEKAIRAYCPNALSAVPPRPVRVSMIPTSLNLSKSASIRFFCSGS